MPTSQACTLLGLHVCACPQTHVSAVWMRVHLLSSAQKGLEEKTLGSKERRCRFLVISFQELGLLEKWPDSRAGGQWVENKKF